MTDDELLSRLLDAVSTYLTDSAKPGHGDIAAKHAALEPLRVAAVAYGASQTDGYAIYISSRGILLNEAQRYAELIEENALAQQPKGDA